MAEDVSKTTIAVLLILTMLIGVLGTWTVLEATTMYQPNVKQVQAEIPVGKQGASASIRLNVKKPVHDTASGKITLKILPQE